MGPEGYDELDWTGERYIPHEGGPVIAYEHLHRYAFAAQFASGVRVLDLGSGEGYGTAILGSRASTALGLDIDPAAVAHANARYASSSLRYEVADITDRLPIDESFDCVVCFEAIEHVASPELIVAEARRVMSPGGVFIVSTPNRKIYSDLPGFTNEFHRHEFLLDEFDSLLREHFPSVEMFGQQIAGVSLAWRLEPTEDSSVEFLEGEGRWQPAVRSPASVFEPTYFLAICSLAPLDGAASGASVFLDRENELVADHSQALARVGALELEALELRTHAEALMSAKDVAVKEMADRTHEVKLLVVERDSLLQELEQMHRTLSWRVTAPLRAVARAMGRGSRNAQSS